MTMEIKTIVRQSVVAAPLCGPDLAVSRSPTDRFSSEFRKFSCFSAFQAGLRRRPDSGLFHRQFFQPHGL